MSVPKSYRSLEEFEREELVQDHKVGFSLDDLIHESTFSKSDMLFDDTFDAYADPVDDDD